MTVNLAPGDPKPTLLSSALILSLPMPSPSLPAVALPLLTVVILTGIFIAGQVVRQRVSQSGVEHHQLPFRVQGRGRIPAAWKGHENVVHKE